ncbi:MAG: mono/diheme cytochrome c family protein [Verrucomicrobiales bacterium]|jgi:mono/diheme cytochrome c family protein
MRWFFLTLIALTVMVVSLAGFRGTHSPRRPLEFLNDMDDQAKIKAQSSSDFFADGMGARNPVVGTVPMGYTMPEITAQSGGFEEYGFTQGKDFYNTGRFDDYWGDGFPEQVAVDEVLIRKGKERFDIYCAICHGANGDGKGVTSSFGVSNIANLHLPQFVDPANGQYRTNGSVFNTITNGQGLMAGYGANIVIHDRWAIIAYMRALQKNSANADATAN